MSNLKKWKTLDSRIVYQNPWMRVRQETAETHTGRVTDNYFIIEAADIAVIFALTSQNEVVLVKQYKHGIKDIVIELPGGGINPEEDPEAAARRELQEETGFTAEEFILVNKTVRNTTNSEVVDYVFLARNASQTKETAFDENELCETLLVSLSQVLEMLRRGEIVDLGNIAALYRVLDYLGALGN